MRRVRRSARASPAARFTAVVVLPTSALLIGDRDDPAQTVLPMFHVKQALADVPRGTIADKNAAKSILGVVTTKKALASAKLGETRLVFHSA